MSTLKKMKRDAGVKNTAKLKRAKKALAKTFNYVIVRSIFSDYWVGKTYLKADEKNIFSKREDAVNRAQDLFCSENPEFDCHAEEGDEQYDWDMYNSWSNIELDSFDCEEIPKNIEDKIVRR